MGRKSLADVRREEILSAFECSIVEHGLAGSSLGRIAALAQVKTSLISHYFGNRAGLVEALCRRLVARYHSLFDPVRSRPALAKPVDAGLRLLFSDSFRDHQLAVISRELVAGALHDEVVRRGLLEAHAIFEGDIYALLSAQYPHRSARDLRAVAVGLLCLAEASVQLASYGHPHARSRARRAAQRLASTLDRD